MKFSLLTQSTTKLLRRAKTFPAMFIGALRSLVGIIYSIMVRATLLTLISCLALLESLVKITAESLASLMLYSTQFIIILLKTFERLTTLSTKTKIMDLVWWRLKLTIKLIRLVGDRINTLRSSRVRLQTKLKPKPTLIMWTRFQERLARLTKRREAAQTKQSEMSSET